ncbi:hypothetical protein [Roseospira goensis]|uniref:Uncharacterized protein n=1 Tax=Roseospira goensis TaxID=391922 RepID=A0A7W6S3B6_9PROT|nr:hypothetical protein [Roseospira goensis]MBB4287409.1 hypothetical protein [Roseospira goensis]
MPRPPVFAAAAALIAALAVTALALVSPAAAQDDPASARAESAALLEMMAFNGGSYLRLMGDEDDMIDGAKEALVKKLRDPESVQWRNIRIVDYAEGRLVCGEYNARNAFGGYVGFQPFASGGQTARMLFIDQDPAIETALNAPLLEACGD